jgi:hypothetical protein
VTNFNERDFIKFLEDNKLRFDKLKRFQLGYKVNDMSAKSVVAILRNSNIVDFKDFFEFQFAGQDLEDLKALAVERGLKIIPLFSHLVDRGRSGWLTCDQGNHRHHD